ncbi:MAG TPA: helix-turn-helix domain-containing protein [Candidatus Thermoplasmatota archaeon]|nr:helix-turn-helix domain-containing protein [Candidatus Thermoplasmatota archaeon]
MGATLALAGIALLLAGTGASLGYQALASDKAPAQTAGQAADEEAGGLALVATLAVDAPLVPLDPVTIQSSPGLLHAAPLPGASIDRELGLDQAGLGCGRSSEAETDASQPPPCFGLDASLELAAGSHRTRETTRTDASAQSATTRAVLTPGAEAIAVAAAALTIAGAIAYSWGGVKAIALRYGLLPAIALYAKISRAEVFDNSVRERIFQAIRDHPGRSASDLARLADVSWGTTIYHLDVLEQTRMVTSLRKGRYRRYFENGATLVASKDIVAVLQNPVTAGVVDTIRRAPGATQKELASATNMTPQALHWHLVRLVENGVVRKEREGRVVRHFCAS